MLDAEFPRRRLLATEVLQMVEAGILGEDEHVELIDGELVVVSPQGPPHAYRIGGLGKLLDRAFEAVACVRQQMPFLTGPDGMPEPDLAVVRGVHKDYAAQHPTAADALLVIEIARTSQRLDRAKAALYARAGVAEYWLLDLVARRLEVRSSPRPDGTYELTRLLAESDDVALPGVGTTIAVATLFE